MISYFQQKQEKIAQFICRHRKCQYTHMSVENFMNQFPQAQFQKLKVKNCREQTLDCLLYSQKKSDTCIIYAHGLGSNKLQIMPNIRKSRVICAYHFCFFDFSGSGRSQGMYTGYGLLQQFDLLAVINFLETNKKYSNYILWGRSMGAVSIILSQNLIFNNKIKLLILDSPYSSFEKIALQMASRKTIFPEVITKPLLESIKAIFKQKMPVNPFIINLEERMSSISIPMLFIYSKYDLVVQFHHSELLMKKCSIKPFLLQINEDHNQQRNFRCIQKIIEHIQQTIKAVDRKTKRANSISLPKRLSIVSVEKNSKRQFNSPNDFHYKTSKNLPLSPQSESKNKLHSTNKASFAELTSYTYKVKEIPKQCVKCQFGLFKESHFPTNMQLPPRYKQHRVISSPQTTIDKSKQQSHTNRKILRRNRMNCVRDFN